MTEKNEWNGTKRIVTIILDVLVFNLSIIVSFWLKFGWTIPEFNFIAYENSVWYISLFFVLINMLLGTYVFYNKRINDIVFTTVIGQILTILFIMIITFIGRWFTFPRSVLGYSLITGFLLLSLSRIFIYYLYIKMSAMKKVVIIGQQATVLSAVRNFVNDKNKKHIVTDVIFSNFYDNLKKAITSVDIVYVASRINEEEKLKIYELVIKNDKKLFLNTSFENLIMIKPNTMHFEDESIIEASGFKINSENDVVKRLVDIIVSCLLLIVVSPFMVLAAIAIKLTSPGPIIYKQRRITKGQKEFDILKFRTMSVTAESKSGPVLAKTNDSRVTGIGKYLRSLRIDELPQLINVIKGDMSIIGPRPERPFFVDQFKEENPHYYLRHNVRAGITGYAQVYGKYASDYNSKLNFDLLYIKNYSLLLDMKILLQTIKILFDKVSSQGIEEEVTNEVHEKIIEKNNIRVYR